MTVIEIYDMTDLDPISKKPFIATRPINKQGGKFYWKDGTVFDLDERKKPSRIITRIIRYPGDSIIVEYGMDGTGIDLLKPVVEAAKGPPKLIDDFSPGKRW